MGQSVQGINGLFEIIVGIFICMMISALFMCWISEQWRKYFFDLFGSLRKALFDSNWLFAIFVALGTFTVLLFLLAHNYLLTINDPSNIPESQRPLSLPYSKTDLFIMLSFCVAIIGAIWAILARIDAEKAFKTSEQTRLAFGNTFDFDRILSNDRDNPKLPHIINYIREPETTVSLYIGFPVVGLFYKKKMDQSSGSLAPITVFMDLLKKLQEVVDDPKTPNYKLYLGIFSPQNIEELSKVKLNQKINNGKNGNAKNNSGKNDSGKNDTAENDMALSDNYVRQFCDIITRLKEKRKLNQTWEKSIIIIDDIPQGKERFRFASVDSDKLRLHRGLIWVVPDFRPHNNVQFTSACFQTQDTSIIKILHRVFEDALAAESASMGKKGGTHVQVDEPA